MTRYVTFVTNAVNAMSEDVTLVAHSLGCIAVAHWARIGRPIPGALLVAPADVEAESIPAGPRGFDRVPLERLPFSSIVVASRDDPNVSLERAHVFVRAWGSTFVNVGCQGHITAASGPGAWPEGRALLNRLRVE